MFAMRENIFRSYFIEKSRSVVHNPQRNKSHVCVFCEKGFLKLSHLWRHLKSHTKEKSYNCKFCDSKFCDESQLFAHIKYRHINEKPHKCRKCNLEFCTSAGLRSHQSSLRHRHVTVFITCLFCNDGKRFFNLGSNFIKHMGKHTREKTYFCPVCFSEFALKHRLENHLITHNDERSFNV